MGYAVELLILHTTRKQTQHTYYPIIIASVRCTLKRIVEHDHHSVAVSIGTRFDEFEIILEVVVEGLYAAEQIRKVYLHVLPLKIWSLA